MLITDQVVEQPTNPFASCTFTNLKFLLLHTARIDYFPFINCFKLFKSTIDTVTIKINSSIYLMFYFNIIIICELSVFNATKIYFISLVSLSCFPEICTFLLYQSLSYST